MVVDFVRIRSQAISIKTFLSQELQFFFIELSNNKIKELIEENDDLAKTKSKQRTLIEHLQAKNEDSRVNWLIGLLVIFLFGC